MPDVVSIGREAPGESTAAHTRVQQCPAVLQERNAQLAANAEMLVQFSQQRRTQLLWDAQRLTNSPDEAEEIVQESLLKAWRNLDQFRGEAQLGTWLRAIVRNTAREWLRTRGARMALQVDPLRDGEEGDPLAELVDTGPDPEEVCLRRESEALLRSELDALTFLSRRAIELCALEEWPLQDAAKALNVGVVAIKSRLFRGRRMLERGLCDRAGGREQVYVP